MRILLRFFTAMAMIIFLAVVESSNNNEWIVMIVLLGFILRFTDITYIIIMFINPSGDA